MTRPRTRLAETIAPYVGEGRTGTTKVSVSLPTDLVRQVQEIARSTGSSVSAVIAAALRAAESTDVDTRDWPVALVGLAQLRGRPPEDLAREAIEFWLAAQGVRPVTPEEWRRRLGELLAERRAVASAAGWSDEDIGRDVDAVVAEVRGSRAARGR